MSQTGSNHESNRVEFQQGRTMGRTGSNHESNRVEQGRIGSNYESKS